MTDPKLASNALIWAVQEMENRYRTLSVYNLTKEQLTQEKVKEILGTVTDQLGGRKPD